MGITKYNSGDSPFAGNLPGSIKFARN